MEIFSYLQTLVSEILPEIVTVLLLAIPVAVSILIVSHKTQSYVRRAHALLYGQTVFFFAISLSLKPLIMSTQFFEAEVVSKASLTLFCFVIALSFNQFFTVYVWEGIFVRKYKNQAPSILITLFSTAVYMIAIYSILTFVFKQPITGLVISSGILVGVLGLAMQSSLADLISGIAISVERPFTIGEWVELDDGTIGEIVEINWRATHILSWHNSLYILPNARISNARIHNFSRPVETYGHWFYVHVPLTVPPELVRRVLLEGCVNAKQVLDDPAPVIRVSEAGGSYKYMVFVHFASYQVHFAGIDDALLHIWAECYKHGIVPSAVTTEVILREGVAEEIVAPGPQQLLKQVPIFTGLADDSMSLLTSKILIRSLALGETIVQQGDEGSSLYVIASGMASIVIQTEGNKEIEVAKLVSGQYFGEQSLLANEPRSATVRAHTDCQLLEINREALEPIFELHPELMEDMAKIVSVRTFENSEASESQNKDDMSGRLNELAGKLLGKIQTVFKKT
jgi:small-conductance mechanosensitive channel/CRP-like cAMP-binding protein